MADIFVSYSRKDRHAVAPIVTHLERIGYSVWWDRNLNVGSSFSNEIEGQLRQAKAVLVVWSENSRKSDWVKDEANYGRENRKLIPISIDATGPPIGFQQLEFVDFAGWRGNHDAECVRRLSTAIMMMIEGRQSDNAQTVPQQHKSPITWRKPTIIGAALVAVLLALGIASWFVTSGVTTQPSEENATSIAVLPFSATTSSTPEYLAASLAEDVNRALSEYPDLLVVSFASSTALAAEPMSIPEYGKRLDVQYVMTGGVALYDDDAVIEVELTDAQNGQRVWVNTFNYNARDLASLQKEIAGELSQLIPTLVRSGRTIAPLESAAVQRTNDPVAYRDFAQGRALASQRTENGMREGIELLMRSVERDPEFADGWAELSIATAIYGAYGFGSPKSAPDPRRTALTALNIDPDQAEAHAALGLVAISDRDIPAAIQHFQRSIAKRPGYANALGWLAWSNLLAGQKNAALAAAERAAELDPLSTDALANLSISYIANERYRDGIEQADLITNIQPTFETAIFYKALGLFLIEEYQQAGRLVEDLDVEWADHAPKALQALTLVKQGQTPKAKAILAELRDDASDPFSIGLVELALGQKKRAWQSFDDVGPPLPGNGYWPAIAMSVELPQVLEIDGEVQEYSRLQERTRAGWGID